MQQKNTHTQKTKTKNRKQQQVKKKNQIPNTKSRFFYCILIDFALNFHLRGPKSFRKLQTSIPTSANTKYSLLEVFCKQN